MPSRHLGTQDQIRDGGTDHHIEQSGKPAIEHCIGDHARAVDQHRFVVLKRVGIGKNGKAPHFGKRKQNDANVRGQDQEKQQYYPGVRQNTL